MMRLAVGVALWLCACASTAAGARSEDAGADATDAGADATDAARCDVYVLPDRDVSAPCDPATHYLFSCQGGGGCSQSGLFCRPIPAECGAGCDRCACVRRTAGCAYAAYCAIQSGVLYLSCPPD